jgi:Protein of unknown function (DUF1553)/Protein of unknown function (DUF1549)
MLRFPSSVVVLTGLLTLGLTRASGASPAQDAQALSARIDELIGLRLAKEEIPPAPSADDAEFFRRLSLDLNGRIPSLTQLVDFLDDTRSNKRRQWVDELLDGPDNAPLYIEHFAHFWRRQFLALTTMQSEAVVVPLEGWLRKQITANAPYDRMVRGLLTDANVSAFYQANENKAENLASRSSRLFLGVKLECAQCHDDRSGGKWKRAQFWQYAAFFTGLRTELGDSSLVMAPRPQPTGPARIRIGGSETWVEARFPDGGQPDWQRAVTPRLALSEWITRRDNPWFARATVNRLWHYFLGVGLIDPVDGLGTEDNPPSHPELLDELVRQFVAHDFDLKFLIRAITGSSTYQRSGRQTDPRQTELRVFARAASRALTPEQLYDSMVLATGYRSDPAKIGAYEAFQMGPPRAMFLAPFDDPNSQPVDFQASIQQALMMMNGKFTEEATSAIRSATVAAVVDSNRPLAQRIDELYLVTLSRKPRPLETQRLLEYATTHESKQALRDIFWSLLNSTEFVLNH